jgi:hypothetical protein
MTLEPLTREQIKEAIEQMRTHCDLKMENYEMVSARGTLYELGYHDEDCEDVLAALYNNGFSYCLDSHFKCSNGIPNNGALEYPSQDACHWGPDQLKSRLYSVRIY